MICRSIVRSAKAVNYGICSLNASFGVTIGVVLGNDSNLLVPWEGPG